MEEVGCFLATDGEMSEIRDYVSATCAICASAKKQRKIVKQFFFLCSPISGIETVRKPLTGTYSLSP